MSATAPTTPRSPEMTQAYPGASTDATRAAREEYRETPATAIQVKRTAAPSYGSVARSTPRAVAPPFPPLKPKNAG